MIRKHLIRILPAIFVCFLWQLAPASESTAKELTMKILNKQLVVHNDSFFRAKKNETVGFHEIEEWKLRPDDIAIEQWEVSRVGVLNGIEWRGKASVRYLGRKIVSSAGDFSGRQWSCWYERVLEISFQKTNGQWSWSSLALSNWPVSGEISSLELEEFQTLPYSGCHLTNLIDNP